MLANKWLQLTLAAFVVTGLLAPQPLQGAGEGPCIQSNSAMPCCGECPRPQVCPQPTPNFGGGNKTGAGGSTQGCHPFRANKASSQSGAGEGRCCSCLSCGAIVSGSVLPFFGEDLLIYPHPSLPGEERVMLFPENLPTKPPTPPPR